MKRVDRKGDRGQVFRNRGVYVMFYVKENKGFVPIFNLKLKKIFENSREKGDRGLKIV